MKSASKFSNAKSANPARTGAEKMRRNHQKTTKQIERLRKEASDRLARGLPRHPKIVRGG